VIRGGREMEDHFECLWDLFRSIPSLEIEGASVLDEFYWLDKDDPNFSLQRATVNRGEDAHTAGLFTLSEQAQKEIVKLFLATREEMENKRINEVFGKEFLSSNFWLYWRTMFAFEEWHSALEMKLYLHRFIHQIRGMPDFSTLKFTKYNQYESLVLPLVKWLLDHGVVFHYGTEVTDVDFNLAPGRKQATRIHWRRDAVEDGVDLGPDDLVFMTIGSLTENSDNGDHHTPANLNVGAAPAWDLWRRIAVKDTAFGRPDVFGSHIPETKWESATVTTLDERIPKYIQKIANRVLRTNADGGCLHTARRRARRAGGIQLHLRHSYAPVRDRPPARRQGDRHPGSCVPAQSADEQARRNPDRRTVARIRSCWGRLTSLERERIPGRRGRLARLAMPPVCPGRSFPEPARSPAELRS